MYQGGDEVSCAVEEGDVVRVRGYAGLVEGYEDIDGRCRCNLAFGCQRVLKVWRKCGGEEVGDFDFVPSGRHAVREIAMESQSLCTHSATYKRTHFPRRTHHPPAADPMPYHS